MWVVVIWLLIIIAAPERRVLHYSRSVLGAWEKRVRACARAVVPMRCAVRLSLAAYACRHPMYLSSICWTIYSLFVPVVTHTHKPCIDNTDYMVTNASDKCASVQARLASPGNHGQFACYCATQTKGQDRRRRRPLDLCMHGMKGVFSFSVPCFQRN